MAPTSFGGRRGRPAAVALHRLGVRKLCHGERRVPAAHKDWKAGSAQRDLAGLFTRTQPPSAAWNRRAEKAHGEICAQGIGGLPAGSLARALAAGKQAGRKQSEHDVQGILAPRGPQIKQLTRLALKTMWCAMDTQRRGSADALMACQKAGAQIPPNS
jgi:hypothetical protein